MSRSRRNPAARLCALVAGGLACVALLTASVSAEEGDGNGVRSWNDWRKLEKQFGKQAKLALEPEAETEAFLAAAAEVADDPEARAAKALHAVFTMLLEVRSEAEAAAAKLIAGISRGRWAQEVHDKIQVQREASRRAGTLIGQLADVVGQGRTVHHGALTESLAKAKDVRWWGIVARIHAHRPKRDAAIRWLGKAIHDPKRDIRAHVLHALASRAKDWPQLISQRIRDPDWAIRTFAARTVRDHANKMAVGELIGALSCASPRVQRALLSSLEALTGKSYGMNIRGWNFWWEEQRRQRAFGPQTSSGAGPTCGRRAYATFYDLELQSNRLVFVVDVSASMVKAAGKGGGFTRLELMKRQLTRTLRRLEPGVEFNIVAFGSKIRPWQSELVTLDDRVRDRAIRWVRALRPSGGSGTYMNGALHHVFQQLGFGDLTRGPMPADTIVLLSDGAPTDGWPGARGKAGRQSVLEALRVWNADRLLVIHTIALAGHAKDFLAAVAKEHGGKATVR